MNVHALLRKKLAQRIYDEGWYSIALWQKRPWTMAEITVEIPGDGWQEGKSWRDIGFSKVNWPDEWDESYGQDMATKKAIASASRNIIKDAFDAGRLDSYYNPELSRRAVLDVAAAISD